LDWNTKARGNLFELIINEKMAGMPDDWVKPKTTKEQKIGITRKIFMEAFGFEDEGWKMMFYSFCKHS